MDNQINVSYRGRTGYPREFEDLRNPPEKLWWRGALPTGKKIAIVGSRAASKSALVFAEHLAERLSASNYNVISGGALGIDGAAHRGAVRGGTPTTAVLGCGIDRIYPDRHKALFAQMLDQGGALLTPFGPKTEPKSWHFPARNLLIAAWAEAIVVVEAQAQSGSLYTAREAQRLGRPVYAVPGTPGTDGLIRQKAFVLPEVADFPLHGGLQARPLPEAVCASEPDSEALRTVLREVRQAPKDVGEIARELDIDVVACASVLLDLELAGWVRRVGGGRYVSVQGVC